MYAMQSTKWNGEKNIDTLYSFYVQVETLRGNMRLLIVNLLNISKHSNPRETDVIRRTISMINAFRNSIPEVSDTYTEMDNLEHISSNVFKNFIQESIIEINKSLKELYSISDISGIYIDISQLFPNELNNQGNVYNLATYRDEREAKEVARSGLFLRRDIPLTTSLSAIRRTEERIAKNLGASDNATAAQYSALKHEQSIRLNQVQPEKISPSIQENIIKRSIATGDTEMLEAISHYMQYNAANDNSYDQRNIYAHPRLSMHIRNLRKGKPIYIKTTRGEMDILDIEEYFPGERTNKTYYKAYIIFRGKRQTVLLSDESFRVGDISDKIFGVFDASGNIKYNQIGDNQFGIISICSHKTEYIKKGYGLGERLSRKVSSIKNKILGILGK